MAQIRPRNPDGPGGHEGPGGGGEPSAERPRRRGLRYGVPVAVAGVAAATVGLVPALASAGQPDLPKITAKQLVAKMAASDVQQMSGTVKLSTDLGLPEMPGTGGGGQGGGSPFGGPHGSGGDDGSGDGAGDGGKSAADPQSKLMSLASGDHKLRVAADGPEKQRVSLVEEASEYSLIHNADEVWGYDSGSDSAYHAEAPAAGKHHKSGGSGKGHQGAHGPGFGKGLQDATPQEAAAQALKAVDDSTSVSVDGTAKIAGRDAYQLVIEPKGAPHSTVESVRIGVDAKNGTPLKFTLTPKEGGKAAIDAAYTDVDFRKPADKTFDFEPPKGTDVTEAKPGEHKSGAHEPGSAPGSRPGGEDGKPGAGPKGEHAMSGTKVLGEGWDSIAMIKNGKGVPGSPAAGGSGAGPATLEAGPGQQGGKSGQGEQMLDGFTEKAEGDFGTGRVVSTRLVNALMTDDGTVYVGAVTKEGLIKAADSAAR